MRVVKADLDEGAMMGAGPGYGLATAKVLANWKPVPPLYVKWTVDKNGKLVPLWKEAA